MEAFMESFLTVYLPLLLAAWPIFALLATFTPTETDNKLLAALRKVLDLIAFNFGNAKNESDKPKAKGLGSNGLPKDNRQMK